MPASPYRPRSTEIARHNSKSGVRKDMGVRFPPSAFGSCRPTVPSRSGARHAARAFLAVVVGGLAIAALGCGETESKACAQTEYGGPGNPDHVLVSDLPLHGSFRMQALQINDAVRAELKRRAYEAGGHTIGFRACDDSTARAARSDPGTCRSNADAYAADDQVIGVIGPLDSNCAAILIPALNLASGGGIPLVSPSNTYPCLTRGGAGCDLSEPGKYYPSGRRNYLRVRGNDLFQGAADAQFARDHGVRKVYVLHDNEAYGVGLATDFRRAAESLGLEVVGFDGWNPAASTYSSLFREVRSSRADAIFLGGLIDQNGGRVIEDKVAVLGPNDGDVRLIASDGFATRRTIHDAGAAAEGMYVSAAGVPYRRLPAAAKAYADEFVADYLDGKPLRPDTIYGAQAARVMLDAIAKSDGTRRSVTARLFETKVTDGLLGTFGFDENGDPARATGPVVGFTIFKVDRQLRVETTIDPEASTVEAAAGS